MLFSVSTLTSPVFVVLSPPLPRLAGILRYHASLGITVHAVRQINFSLGPVQLEEFMPLLFILIVVLQMAG